MHSSTFAKTLPPQKCILAETPRRTTLRQNRCGPLKGHLLEAPNMPPLYAGHTPPRAIQKCYRKVAEHWGGARPPGRPGRPGRPGLIDFRPFAEKLKKRVF